MAHGEGFVYMEVWRKGFRTSGLKKKGGGGGGVLGKGFVSMEVCRKGFRTSGLKRGVVLGKGFIYTEVSGKSFRTSSFNNKQKGGGGGVLGKRFFPWKYKGKVSEQVVLKEGWSLVKDSFTWKYEGKVSEQVVLTTTTTKSGGGGVLGEGFISMEGWGKGFRTSGTERGMVSHRGLSPRVSLYTSLCINQLPSTGLYESKFIFYTTLQAVSTPSLL